MKTIRTILCLSAPVLLAAGAFALSPPVNDNFEAGAPAAFWRTEGHLTIIGENAVEGAFHLEIGDDASLSTDLRNEGGDTVWFVDRFVRPVAVASSDLPGDLPGDREAVVVLVGDGEQADFFVVDAMRSAIKVLIENYE